MHWFERNFVFNNDNSLKQCLKFWKRQVDDVFFVWSGSKDDLELFVWHLNGGDEGTVQNGTGEGKLSTVFGCGNN